MSLAVAASNLYTGGLDKMVAYDRIEGSVSFSAAVQTTEQPYLGSALLTSHEEGIRKGVLKIVCLHNDHSAYRG